jgi:hypothetical protein
MSELGVRFYEGPSLLTGAPIVGVLTGLEGGSHNPKTGPMVQAWVIRRDLRPMDAKRANLDDAICGDCKLRGHDGVDSGCYVAPWLAPGNVFRTLPEYPVVDWPELRAVVEGRVIRLCAYGDPAAVPFDVWRVMVEASTSYVGYTHQWPRCDPRLKTICMASVDTLEEHAEASAQGWRTFRIRRRGEDLIAGAECVCPASDEANHRTTCQSCKLCQGTSKPARGVAIYAHGKPSSLRMFRS